MRRIRWTQRALNDLRLIGRYVAMHNPQAARRLLIRLRSRVRGVVDFPFSGRIVPELTNDRVREVLEGNYRIIYEVNDDSIDVMTVFEAHRLLPLEAEEEEAEE